MPDLHTLAILCHALSAIGAFVVGVVLIVQSDRGRQLRLGRVLVALLVSLEVFLILAVVLHLSNLTTIKRVTFAGLALLALYMIFRAVQAVSVLRDQPENQAAVVDHVGFDLISLFDGFAIVSAIDLRAPAWLVAIIAAGAVALGIFAITSRKKQLAALTG